MKLFFIPKHCLDCNWEYGLGAETFLLNFKISKRKGLTKEWDYDWNYCPFCGEKAVVVNQRELTKIQKEKIKKLESDLEEDKTNGLI